MTNNEKIKRIQSYVIDAAVAASSRCNTKDRCSAEWIYDQGWRAAMVRVKDVINDIIDQEE